MLERILKIRNLGVFEDCRAPGEETRLEKLTLLHAAWLTGVALGGGLTGIWWGIVAGHVLYAPLAFAWAMHSLRRWKPSR